MSGIIDFHTHFFRDDIAAAAVGKLEQTSGYKAFSDGTLAGLISSMDRAGIERSLVLQVATKASQVGPINNYCLSIQNDRIRFMAAFYPNSPDWEKDLQSISESGFRGVKVHPDYQEFHPDAPALLPVFDMVRQLGLIFYTHAGNDLSFEPPGKGGPHRLAALLDALPGLKLHAAHMGSFTMWDAVEECLIGRDVTLDTSFSIGFMEDERLLRMIRNHGVDKILYGSDSPWRDQKTEVDKLSALGLTDDELEMIFSANAKGLLGL